jgi:hypothetical protein
MMMQWKFNEVIVLSGCWTTVVLNKVLRIPLCLLNLHKNAKSPLI